MSRFPTFSIYGKGHGFSLNCMCHETLQLENYMTVRSKYVPRRSICHDGENQSVPTGTKRRGEIPGQEGIRVERQNKMSKNTADFKPCGISEKYADYVQLSIRNSDTSNSEPNSLFRVTILRNANGHTEP